MAARALQDTHVEEFAKIRAETPRGLPPQTGISCSFPKRNCSALPVLEELSDEPLGEDFGEDFAEMLSPRLRNAAVGPVPDLACWAKPLMGEYRAFSRISKMTLLVEKGAKIFDSKEIKSARLAHLGYTVVQLLTPTGSNR